MLTGLHKFAAHRVRERASSPKLQVLNTALISAQARLAFDEAREDRETWGRLVESAVGAHLINSAAGMGVEIFYWRERSREVDFVLTSGKTVVAIEIKSGALKEGLPGTDAFEKAFKPKRKLLVGEDGIPLEKFLLLRRRNGSLAEVNCRYARTLPDRRHTAARVPYRFRIFHPDALA